MVDLVKIRKKAKKGQEAQPSVAAAAPAAEHEKPQTPTAEAAVATQGTQEPAEPNKLSRFVEEAGRRRVQVAAEAAAEEDQETALLELLAFSIAGEQYALSIEHIVEIVPPRAVTRIPNADASVVGIMSLRGTIVTIVDVRRRLRHPPAGESEGAESRIIVVEYGGETIGFQVDRVWRVVKISPGDVEPHPVVHASELSESIRGVFRQANALTILLDFDKLLDGREQPAAS